MDEPTPSATEAQDPCPHCGGYGRVHSPINVVTRIERFLGRAANDRKHRNLVVSVNPVVAKYLLENEGHRLEYLARRGDRVRASIHEDPRLTESDFRVFSLDTHDEITGRYDSDKVDSPGQHGV